MSGSELIFISAKREDYPYAREYYDYLTERGLSVFLSDISLRYSDFRKAIDDALDQAKHMIVVTTSAQNVRSKWVEAEWGLFINELRSGRKSGELITITLGGLSLEELPIGLRGLQVIPGGPDSFEKVYRYVAPPALNPKRSPTPAPEFTNQLGMKFKLIPAGEFMMGNAESDAELLAAFPDANAEYFADERPAHRVKISQPFYMGVYQVTQKEFREVIKEMEPPWKGQPCVQEGDRNAASYINWEDANQFCQKLIALDGKKYRLPTEAEWEYACRAGSKTRYSFGDDDAQLGDYAWYRKNAQAIGEAYAHPVGEKRSNAFGLYDMHGNVWEWCDDIYDNQAYSKRNGLTVDPNVTSGSGDARVLRGGSWYNYSWNGRSADRVRFTPDLRNFGSGFRVVCALR